MTMKLYGAILSPYVRKTRMVLALKGLDYESVMVDPNNKPEGYEKISPLGRIPALEVDGRFLADSAVICAYLEGIQPQPFLYPKDAFDHARALWFEKYADYELGPECTFRVFRNRVVKRLIGKACNEEECRKALDTTIPPLFDYLERELEGREYLVGDQLSIADIAVASQMVNFAHGGESPDAGRHPNLAAHTARLHGLDPFAQTIEKESGFLKKVLG
ncbi:glutathione S-transferase family protein [Alloalcanivorax gelatiniphagus]|uniref:Glutathione S-transferase family protein n=1 Tax=Alloalcanivorax gelatiniphagus TaxID=1194167 RepID=A0ABY2XL55_9GAMM|nr:glutathione S-transferase family protein [Alloalcanivorax gelatiniphagus]TMW12858.1 glutathione S-transferase family protein [Alloalcanivorax gelatiniphagus]